MEDDDHDRGHRQSALLKSYSFEEYRRNLESDAHDLVTNGHKSTLALQPGTIVVLGLTTAAIAAGGLIWNSALLPLALIPGSVTVGSWLMTFLDGAPEKKHKKAETHHLS